MSRVKSYLYRRLRPLVGLRAIEANAAMLSSANDRFEAIARDYRTKILDYCRAYIPYYRQALGKRQAVIGNFGVLTKSDLRRHFDSMISSRRRFGQYKNSSGGSTGEPVTFIQDKHYASWSEATLEYFFRNLVNVADYLGESKVVLWGSERDILQQSDRIGAIYNFLTNTRLLNTFRVSQKRWREYAQTLRATRPTIVKGYAGSLYRLCVAAREAGLWLPRPRVVYSSAEMLYPEMRQTIESVFGTRVTDFYGSREVGPIAGQCRLGRYHAFIFFNWLEILDNDNRPCPPGQVGRVIVTNLHNYSMPLVRYELGDLASWGKGRCRCGCALPWLEKIAGRIVDHFVTGDGTLVHGEYFTHLFYHVPEITSFQVLQTKPDAITIFHVGSPISAAFRDDIAEKIRLVMGDDCRIVWKKVKAIAPTPQGKHLFTKSLVNPKNL